MKNLIIALVLLVGRLSQAEVIETNLYSDVLKYLTPDTLVVTDLDNTVIQPQQMLGSDQWGEAMGKKLLAAGFEKDKAVEMHVSMFALIQQFTKVKTVEVGTVDVIKVLKQKNVPVLGLTARPVYIADRTIELLNSVKVQLSGLSEVADVVQRDTNVNKIVYKSGVVFVGPMNNKGLILKSIVDQLKNTHFKRIIFIDDKPHHTANVDKAFENSGIQVKALRYGAADKDVASYDAQVADFEWSYFANNGLILSDEKAREIMKKGIYSDNDYVVCDIPVKDYPAFLKSGSFGAESLEKEGFIHCAKPSQMPHVIEKYFVEEAYVVFVSHKSKLTEDLVYEGADPNNLYPHLRRTFRQADIINTIFMNRNAQGKFELPIEFIK